MAHNPPVDRANFSSSTAFKDATGNHPTKLVVGLVGYPNVGKSSAINALIGEKKVSVSSTPGKTKHFQTINLSLISHSVIASVWFFPNSREQKHP